MENSIWEPFWGNGFNLSDIFATNTSRTSLPSTSPAWPMFLPTPPPSPSSSWLLSPSRSPPSSPSSSSSSTTTHSSSSWPELPATSTAGNSPNQQESHLQLHALSGTGKKRYLNTYCVFCKNNKETLSFYSSHVLKDDYGRVTCPVLREYQCPICQAKGDDSHTLKYCPLNQGSPSRNLQASPVDFLPPSSFVSPIAKPPSSSSASSKSCWSSRP